ncbi:helix-turn-helix transcriptional regulator [Paenarthrobacter sp. Z7-10]|uniref:helix-turn-helix domain-containing protein n=1 Tax=Paenarthrobacter sp. Z7-10 TaxID=2787635 RepID=UPI0022A92ACD|nr:helix-turn-helix transcriptional regulator [Paenarthrobacter sp. Z7-10]MCZ2404398.1 helix-turn-helix transcriptional regulator [Paenarthrobacter sp. Z7-10]
MKRDIEYRWRARELMARNGMRNTRELVEPLRERGITLSESQIYRMVSQNPERISFQLLAALCDIFGVEANELFIFTAADARSKGQKQAVVSGENVVRFADAYKPVRARILDDD